MLDVAWYGLVPAQFACQVGKPAFIASRLTHRFCGAEKLLRRAAQTGVTLMPDFAHRYTPATSRLRELIATRLGRPQGLVVDVAAECAPVAPGAARSDAERDMLAVALDWIISLVGGMPIAVRASKHESTADYFGLHVEFRRPSAGGAAPAALIRLAAKPPVSSPNGFDRSPALRASVECVHGKALLEGPQDMKWDLSGEQFIESLASDRPAIEVMLDHFCRRVVGGLIPIPTFDDLYRVFQLVDAALEPQSRMNTSYTSRGSA
jgi:predicted dehydrogenase